MFSAINFPAVAGVISVTRMENDSDLISRAATGDHSAFQMLVERHRALVYRVAYQFAGNHYDAEDIAQDVFIKVYRSLARFRQDAQLTSWMYRIAMNACIDHRRRHVPAASAPFGEEAEHKMMNIPEEAPGPEETTYAGELGRVLDAEISRLPPGQRMVFIMRHHQGLKLGEIAAALGLAEGTVKRQLHAAVHRLRHGLTTANVTAGSRA
ncbi:MAG: sigma-70 family RNA polymerase sigma factor [Nitrospira sp.]|nr:sigma-70 family RNA polymerase sigma factor [Nitrospira sp.]